MVPFYGAQVAASLITQQLESLENCGAMRWLLVDNGSEPRIDFGSQLPPNVMTLRIERNAQFGGALKNIGNFRYGVTHVCWLPGNGKIQMRDAEDWVKQALKTPSSISKARRLRGKKWEIFKTQLASVFLSTVTGVSISDPGGTPTLFPAKLFDNFIEYAPNGIEIEAYTIAWATALRLNLERPAIPYGERASGVSSWRRGLGSELKMLASFWRAINLAKIQSASAK